MNKPISLSNSRFDANTLMRERILRALHNLNFSAFRDLEVVAADEAVTLRGCLRSFYEKQVVLSHSMRIMGNYKLVDEMVVQTES